MNPDMDRIDRALALIAEASGAGVGLHVDRRKRLCTASRRPDPDLRAALARNADGIVLALRAAEIAGKVIRKARRPQRAGVPA